MDLEQSAFEALRFASAQSLKLYNQPLVITYSGGKDSDVLLRLAENSGIPFDDGRCAGNGLPCARHLPTNGRKGHKVRYRRARPAGREARYHVEFNTEENDASDKVGAVLLRRTKGGRRKRAICRDWCSLGRISKTERPWDAGSTTRRYKEAADTDE